MEIIIKGTSEEIAALVSEVQKRQEVEKAQEIAFLKARQKAMDGLGCNTGQSK